MTKYETLLNAAAEYENANYLKLKTWHAYTLAFNMYRREYKLIEAPTPEKKQKYDEAIDHLEDYVMALFF